MSSASSFIEEGIEEPTAQCIVKQLHNSSSSTKANPTRLELTQCVHQDRHDVAQLSSPSESHTCVTQLGLSAN